MQTTQTSEAQEIETPKDPKPLPFFGLDGAGAGMDVGCMGSDAQVAEATAAAEAAKNQEPSDGK